MVTTKCDVWELEAGDEYIVGLVGGGRASRTVLGVLQRTPMNGALLEVRDDEGNVFRSHMSGAVDLIQRSGPHMICGCGRLFFDGIEAGNHEGPGHRVEWAN